MINIKVNIVVGGRFHASQIYNALKKNNIDVKIYSSSPAHYFKDVPRNDIFFIPKLFQFIQKVCKIRLPRLLHDFDKFIFGNICKYLIRDADILWGFNGDTLEVAKKIKKNNKFFILDRACPHINYQQRILEEESKKISYVFEKHSQKSLNKYIQEYNLADLIVVPSNYSANTFRKEFNKKIRILPLDVNLKRGIKNQKKYEIIGNPDAFRVGVVGGSFIRKGLIYLLRAIDLIGIDDVQLLIRAPKNNILVHKESFDICMRRNIKFVPHIDDINDFYKNLDIFVLPSIDEGFGMVAYEALRNGVPLIASNHVGSIDGMKDGHDALIFESGNFEHLREQMYKLYKDKSLRARIGQNGRNFYNLKVANGNIYNKEIRSIISELISGI